MKVVKNALYILVFARFVACNSNVDKSNSTNSTPFKLSDTSASDQAILLYNNMAKLANRKILVGHQDALAYGIGWKDDEFRSDINDVCGDYPAIFGWDLGHIGDSTNIDDVSFEKMKQWALKTYAKGGINTYGWHARNVVNDSSSWNLTPCVQAILPNGEKHEAYLVKLNLVADFFAEIKNDKGELIPVLFRPFHEMNGGWFWWGKNSCTTEEYKALWKFTVDYLRKVRQLHNILYVYSTDAFASADEYMAYYPGDEYVDMLGYDDYKGLNEKGNTPKAINMIETIADLGNKKGKLYTISETGLETIPNEVWFTNVVLETLKTNSKTLGVSYVLFWRNGRPDHFYAPYPGHSSAADFVSFKEDEATLFLSEIQNIYTQEF
jgi:mannan endo-1,4-beta-mannosidase